MQIDTRYTPFQVTNPGGNVTGTLTEPLPTTTPPYQVTAGVTTQGDGVLDMGYPRLAPSWGGGLLANGLKLIPYGAGSATQTYTLKVYGWDPTIGGTTTGPVPLWVPHLLASFTITLGTAPGIAQTDVNASQLFATTIALITGNANVSNEVVSPTGNVIGHIMLDAKGSAFVEARFTMVSATSGNCLAKRV